MVVTIWRNYGSKKEDASTIISMFVETELDATFLPKVEISLKVSFCLFYQLHRLYSLTFLL